MWPKLKNAMAAVLICIKCALFKNSRNLQGVYAKIALSAGALISVFYFYTAIFGIFSAPSHRAIFFSGAIALVFLWFPATEKSPKDRFTITDILAALTVIGSGFYFIAFFHDIVMRPGVFHLHETIISWIIIILSLEAARRSLGIALPIVSVLAILYTFPLVARNLPDLIMHSGMSIERISAYIFGSFDGIFGPITHAFATHVLPFVIFGAFLQKSGAGQFFIDLPYSLVGRLSSGPAMTAVVASTMMGSIVGSPVANVVATGTFTIPLMKKSGYSSEDAGAVETVASSGSCFMPPVMGAAAFFMVEFTGIPYIEIVRVAFIPAILFAIGVGIMVHLYAKKNGLQGVPADQLPNFKELLKKGWYFFLPLVVLLFFLIQGNSPGYSATMGSLSCFLVSLLRKETRMTPVRLWEAFEISFKSILGIAVVTGSVGIIVAVIVLTGLGLRFASIVIAAAGGDLMLTILYIAIAATILGMAAPITAVYAILAMIAPPALVELGVSVMAAHLLLIWYSQLSGITPPVCLVAYAAAAIAGGNPFATGVKAFRYGLLLIILPLLFVYTPLLLEGTLQENLITISTSLLAVIGTAIFLQGYLFSKLNLLEFAMLGIGTVGLFTTNLLYNIVGLALVALVFITQSISRKKQPACGKTVL